MSRWHDGSCRVPNIVLEDGTPRCTACCILCPLQTLRSSHPRNPALTLPPPEEPGRLNLRWPPSVFNSPANPGHDGSAPSAGPVPATPPNSPTKTNNPPTSPVYGRLAPQEFRLACLAAVSDVDFPVHMTLEVYDRDNCPEYETVSYTWGGEDEDYTPSRPIYIGPYWDVVFQPRNCWEMLRFIRPWRGVRMVWVDALCINQTDVEERGAQVATMGDIYRRCSRVIVYLGPDLAAPSTTTFAQRCSLGEIRLSSSLSFRQLFARKYFKRVWVIQELLLAPRAVIHVAGVDYAVDRAIASEFETDFWHSTAAPWLQFLTQESFANREIYDVLRLTSNSLSSDPRDRIFAILALIQGTSWQPDYSLSPQQVFVGLSAHLLIDRHDATVLLHSTGVSPGRSGPHSPSWALDWQSQQGWRRYFALPESKGERQRKTITELRTVYSNRFTSLNRNVSSVYFEHSERWHDLVATKRPWHCSMAVDTMTGALSIHAARIFSIEKLSHHKRISNMDLYEVRGAGTSLFLASPQRDTAVPSGRGLYLYAMWTSTGASGFDSAVPATYLILRSLNQRGISGSGMFELVAASQDLFVEVQNSDPANSPVAIESLEEQMELVQTWLWEGRRPRGSPLFGPFFFPGAKSGIGFLPAALAFVRYLTTPANPEVDADQSKEFISRYIECIPERYSPVVSENGDWLTLSLKRFDDFRERLQHIVREESIIVSYCASLNKPSVGEYKKVPNRWEWRRKYRGWKALKDEGPSFLLGDEVTTLHVRVPVEQLKEVFAIYCEPLERMLPAFQGSIEGLGLAIADGLLPQHRHIGVPSLWFARAFGSYLRYEQIRIF
ncbi:heterokaryon incompatibility protein-domain-containing protein [Echria macrotheca]|uniref:Heterokaryon incompatibility protein-domain-containing protein n=1 Tax=Echria macrotheca TaxID=438768 RepID=A0AAJ0BEF5_9PEZI|nr:heterokaryon incompatibility protein-domain-containing protein [Echria macrotheca]